MHPWTVFFTSIVGIIVWIAAAVYFKLQDSKGQANWTLWSWSCSHENLINGKMSFKAMCVRLVSLTPPISYLILPCWLTWVLCRTSVSTPPSLLRCLRLLVWFCSDTSCDISRSTHTIPRSRSKASEGSSTQGTPRSNWFSGHPRDDHGAG